MKLFALILASALTLGLLVAFAIRSRTPRLRWTSGVAVLTTAGIGAALIMLIPPRGEISDPQYYAHGPDIPRALEAVEAARRTSGVLDQELDAQLVGLARLVVEPGRRRSLAKQPVITVASDLHNNTVGLGVLERLSNGGPVFFVGDLTDRGSQLETQLVRRAAHSGKPFVFVSGNHDSDYLSRELSREGAIVLTQTGRMRPDGTTNGKVITTVGGLQVAGYSDPFERRSAEAFRDRYDDKPNPAEQDKFSGWLQPLIGKVDIVMVHEPALIAPALQVLKDDPPSRPLVFLVGHTHTAALTEQPGVTVINGGSIGAGGTGNLGEQHESRHRALRLHAQTVVPAARRGPRLDRSRDGLVLRSSPAAGPRSLVSGACRWRPCGTSCWSWIATGCGIRTARCPPRTRRCRWSRRRVCACSWRTGAS